MTLSELYAIKSKSKTETFSVTVKLDEGHELYKGHFPNKPITAGAALIQILKDLVEEEVQNKLMLREASNIKFLTIVDPNENNELIYDFKIEIVESSFKIKNTTTFPDGTIVLKCNVTFVSHPELHFNSSNFS